MAVPGAAARREAASPRSELYALFSELTSPPFGRNAAPGDGATATQRLRLARASQALPYLLDPQCFLDAAECQSEHPADLPRIYGSLFDVGTDGPPVPLRAELAPGRSQRAKEEIVRYFDYFGYRLDGALAWAPDHLSVLLEFMHFLTYRQAAADGVEGAESLALAQLDFLERHLLDWLPAVVPRLRKANAPGYYMTQFDLLVRFLDADASWLGRLAGQRKEAV